VKRLTVIIALLLCATVAIPATPALVQTPAPAAAQGPMATLKLTVVISRFSGEKKIGNLPFVLLLTPTDSGTTVQMSSSVPVPESVAKDGVQSYTYRTVGTNISASSKESPFGQYLVNLSISDSQMLSDALAPSEATKGLMRPQQFSSTVRLPLKDAQTVSYNAATDKLTGDLVRVEVTLNVLK